MVNTIIESEQRQRLRNKIAYIICWYCHRTGSVIAEDIADIIIDDFEMEVIR